MVMDLIIVIYIKSHEASIPEAYRNNLSNIQSLKLYVDVKCGEVFGFRSL
jgi:hypothetical protein